MLFSREWVLCPTIVVVVVVAVDPVVDVGHCVKDSERHSSEPESYLLQVVSMKEERGDLHEGHQLGQFGPGSWLAV